MQFLNWSAFTSTHDKNMTCEHVPEPWDLSASLRIFAARKGASVAPVPGCSTQMQFSVEQTFSWDHLWRPSLKTHNFRHQGIISRILPNGNGFVVCHLSCTSCPRNPSLKKIHRNKIISRFFKCPGGFFYPFHLNSSLDRCRAPPRMAKQLKTNLAVSLASWHLLFGSRRRGRCGLWQGPFCPNEHQPEHWKTDRNADSDTWTWIYSA